MSKILSACQAIDLELPAIARSVISRYLDPADPETADFLERPDAREHHQVQWHQWGIITHTRVFLRHYQHSVPEFLQSWNVWPDVGRHLSLPIDGAPRRDLLCISILLHDIGKFAARTGNADQFHFAFHERFTGKITREQVDLHRYGLTPNQIEYVATTAEDHFVLGLLRKSARSHGRYDQGYPMSPEFRTEALAIKGDHPTDYIEIGVLFLGDSLAKLDPGEGPARAVSQYDRNIALARRYLEVVLDSHPSDRNT